MLMNLPAPVLLILSILANWISGIVRNQYSKKHAINNADVYLFLVICQTSGLAILLATSTSFHVSIFTVWTAVLFGVVCIVLNIMLNKALQTGPMGIFNILISSATLIPALSGAIFWQEKLTLAIVCGMLCMLLMVFLVTSHKKDNRSVVGAFWLYCLIAVLLNGAVGILQKVHQTSPFREELDAFLVISFTVSALFPIVFYFRERHKGAPLSVPFSCSHAPFWLAVSCGVCAALPHRINLFLSGVMDSAIFFPLVNGSGLLLSVFAAVLFYKEKLTVRQFIGIVVGIMSILLLSGIV